ncbi:MAG: protein TolB [Thermodesulfobacteriota bacterium]
MLTRLLTITLACLLFLPAALRAERVIDIDITDAAIRKVNLAVPWFQDKNLAPGEIQQSGKKMADLLSRSLEFHGFIDVVPPWEFGEASREAEWARLNVSYYINGYYQMDGGQLTMEMRLVEVNSGRMILGKRYRDRVSRQGKMIRKFCDQVILKLSGLSGISASMITFVADSSGHKEIYMTDVLGDNIRQITKHRHMAISPRLSPDGNKLLYTSYHRGNPNLYLIDFKKSAKLTRAISRRPGVNYAPSWAPDGRSLVLTLSKDGNPDLYRLNLAGEVLARLTRNSGINVSASFSPDGKQLAYVSDRSGGPQIYIMNMASGHSRRLTYEGMENTTPSWSPDGKWIAYTCRAEGTYHIFKTLAAGRSRPQQLTMAWGSHESPTWSPDGRQIAFSRKRGENNQLCAMNADGSGQRVLFSMAGNLSAPQWSKRLNLY